MPGKKGQSGGKRENAGRKTKAEELELQALLDECWTLEDRKACIRGLAEKANSSGCQQSMEAVKLLMAYTYGKPVDHKEITGKGGKDLIPPIVNVVIETSVTDKPQASAKARPRFSIKGK
jgi:hypothetical protein